MVNGTSVYCVIKLSNIQSKFEKIDIDNYVAGIFGKVLDGKSRLGPRDYIPLDNDRVEIYRVLTVEPEKLDSSELRMPRLRNND